MRFLGSIEAKTDAKGRVFLPAVFRKVLQASAEENIVLCKDLFQTCLVLYPESVWNEQMDVLRSRLSRWDAGHQQLFRQFVSDVDRSTVTGGFLFPNVICKWPKYSNASSLLAWATPSKYGVRHTHAVLLWRQTSLVRLSKR